MNINLFSVFSFNEVREYLQQHLSSVENSILVGEEDKSELYALYINCIEVNNNISCPSRLQHYGVGQRQ